VAEEVTGDWRKLHIEKLYDLYCPFDFSGMVKSRRMR